MKKRKPPKMPTTPAARARYQMKYPRAVDKLHGLTQVDELFDWYPGRKEP